MQAFQDRARQMLTWDEGRKKFPYHCSEGKLTIGIGHNLEANGISDKVIDAIFDEDLIAASLALREVLGESTLEGMGDIRKLALLNMVFQLGKAGFAKFQKLILAVKEKRWSDAGAELRHSLLYKQTPSRAERVALMLEREMWPYS